MKIRAIVVFIALAAGAAQADTAVPSAVAAKESGIGTLFTTADGRTLYTYDNDVKANVSACVERCAVNWPPLLAEAATSPNSDWAIVVRPDGSKQWAYRGKPLYTYVRDTQPGATLGDGLSDVWHVALARAARPPQIKFQGTIHGRVAANAKGMSLYTSERDCTGVCLNTWTPLAAPWTASATGDWSAVTRSDDGTKQWAYRGKTLYTYARDIQPGDLRGEGVDSVWRAVILQPTPPLPPWVTLQNSDYGRIFADAKGMTLYAAPDLKKMKQEATCTDECFRTQWTPILATDGAKATGNWTLVEVEAGRKQWAYRGELVFTFNADKKPSDISGDKFAIGAGFGGFHVLSQASLAEETL